jgi:protein SERAC1
VVDWLLDSVVRGATQAEAARALAHLVADPWVAPTVLGRPGAVPCLLQFIFSYQPKRGKKVRRGIAFRLFALIDQTVIVYRNVVD